MNQVILDISDEAAKVCDLVEAIRDIVYINGVRQARSFLTVYEAMDQSIPLVIMAAEKVGCDIAVFITDRQAEVDAGKFVAYRRERDLEKAVRALLACEATPEQCNLITAVLETDANSIATIADDLGFNGHSFVAGLVADGSWIVLPDLSEAEELAAAQEEQRRANYREVLMKGIEKFRAEMQGIAQETISNLYSDALPHISDDTEANISHRVQGAIANLVEGKFERLDSKTGWSSTMVQVSDGYGGSHFLNMGEHSSLVAPIVALIQDELVQARIKQLEAQVESYKKLAYRM